MKVSRVDPNNGQHVTNKTHQTAKTGRIATNTAVIRGQSDTQSG